MFHLAANEKIGERKVDINWVGAAKNYAALHTDEETVLYRQSMDALAAELDPELFVRIHRSTYVRMSQIISLETSDRKQVVLRDGSHLNISAAYLNNLIERLRL